MGYDGQYCAITIHTHSYLFYSCFSTLVLDHSETNCKVVKVPRLSVLIDGFSKIETNFTMMLTPVGFLLCKRLYFS